MLQGVTGSGKTIVYFEALKKILEKGFQGLIMLPEIGLTNQFEKKEHVLVLRDPMEQHKHAAYLHGMSLHSINQKRDNMFYSALVVLTMLNYVIPSTRLTNSFIRLLSG